MSEEPTITFRAAAVVDRSGRVVYRLPPQRIPAAEARRWLAAWEEAGRTDTEGYRALRAAVNLADAAGPDPPPCPLGGEPHWGAHWHSCAYCWWDRQLARIEQPLKERLDRIRSIEERIRGALDR